MADSLTHPEQAAQDQTSQAAPSSPSLKSAATAPPSDVNKGDSIIKWPVPHVMVFLGNLKLAYGREGIAQLGRAGFEKELFSALVWKRTAGRTKHNLDFDFEHSTFTKTAILLGVFHAVHGKDDVEPVILGHVGWAGMVQNLVSITVDYEEETAK